MFSPFDFLNIANARVRTLRAVGDACLRIYEVLPRLLVPPPRFLGFGARAEEYEGEEFGKKLNGTNRYDDNTDGFHVVVKPLDDLRPEVFKVLIAVVRHSLRKHFAKVCVFIAVALWKGRLRAIAAAHIRAVDEVGHRLSRSLGVKTRNVDVQVTCVREQRDSTTGDEDDNGKENNSIQAEHALVVVLCCRASPEADAKRRATGNQDRPKRLLRVHCINRRVCREKVGGVSYGDESRDSEDRVEKDQVTLGERSANHVFFIY